MDKAKIKQQLWFAGRRVVLFFRTVVFKKKTAYISLVGLFLLPFVWTLFLMPSTPVVPPIGLLAVPQTSIIYSADNVELGRIQYENRIVVKLDSLSPWVVPALLAIEDHQFYDHNGINWKRTFGSAWLTLWGNRQGGSTITQQLARNLYPEKIGNSINISRKIKEMLTAREIESTWTKNEILETYLNTVPFGYNVYGIEMAAKTYFQKSASDLALTEAATLVGMLKATSYYNPVRYPERARRRRNLVISQMKKFDFLTTDDHNAVINRPLDLNLGIHTAISDLAPHFVMKVRKQIYEWAKMQGYNPAEQGFVVYTTLDVALQKQAIAAVQAELDKLQIIADVEWGQRTENLSENPADYIAQQHRVRPFGYFWNTNRRLENKFIKSTRRFKTALSAGGESDSVLAALREDRAFIDSLRQSKSRLEGGFVAVEPQTGAIRAYVGGRDYKMDQFDHAGQAKRQPGSTFKPFVYASLIDNGYSPYHTFPDSAVRIDLGNGEFYTPNSDRAFTNKPVTLRDGLALSNNIITVQAMDAVGPHVVAELAHKMGVESHLEPVPALALGTSAVTLLEMVQSYGTLAAGGTQTASRWITRIEDHSGNVLARFNPESTEVLAPETAFTVVDMMRGVVNRGTGKRLRDDFDLRLDLAGKTGTTQKHADGWFIMMRPDLVAGAWVGFNDQRIRFRSGFWGQGSQNALSVVGNFTKRYVAGLTYRQKAERFLPPAGYEYPRRPFFWEKTSLGNDDNTNRGRPGRFTRLGN